MGFPRQEYWSGLPVPSPSDLPNPGVRLVSPAFAGGFFSTESPGKPIGENTLDNIYFTWLLKELNKTAQKNILKFQSEI